VIALHQNWRLCLCLIRTVTTASDAKEKSLSDLGRSWQCNFKPGLEDMQLPEISERCNTSDFSGN